VRAWIVGVVVAVALAGSGDRSRAADAVTLRAAQARTPIAKKTLPRCAEPSVGLVSFTVNGHARSFSCAPARRNTFTGTLYAVRAWPRTGATERLEIYFPSPNLTGMKFPADLPPPIRLNRLSLPTPGRPVTFIYVDPKGNEWTGPGKVHVESPGRDGVIRGSFTDVSLPHSSQKLPNVILKNGKFRVQFSRIRLIK
jgi:hypothetical protein